MNQKIKNLYWMFLKENIVLVSVLGVRCCKEYRYRWSNGEKKTYGWIRCLSEVPYRYRTETLYDATKRNMGVVEDKFMYDYGIFKEPK